MRFKYHNRGRMSAFINQKGMHWIEVSKSSNQNIDDARIHDWRAFLSGSINFSNWEVHSFTHGCHAFEECTPRLDGYADQHAAICHLDVGRFTTFRKPPLSLVQVDLAHRMPSTTQLRLSLWSERLEDRCHGDRHAVNSIKRHRWVVKGCVPIDRLRQSMTHQILLLSKIEVQAPKAKGFSPQ